MTAKIEKGLLIGMFSITLLCGMLCASALAAYNYDGYSLVTNESGTIKGDVYVSSGSNAGLQGTSYESNIFVTTFSDVPTSGIKWAELKIGVWGGSASREGFANATLSSSAGSYTFADVNLNTNNPSSNVDCCGNGLYLIKYNCTGLSPMGSNSITATINTWPDYTLANTSWLDSRVYGAILIVVAEDGNCYTQYWINQGLENLHKNYTGHDHKDAAITWFNGTAVEGCGCLTVAYLAGDYGQNDFLHFNPPYCDDTPYVSPYNYNFLNAAWNKTYYSTKYQLDGDDVANADNNTHKYFDLHKFCVTGRINNTANNYATFWRAQNDTGVIYDPAWPGVGDGESYYSPFLAVLKIRDCTFDFSNDTSGVAGVDHFAYGYQYPPDPSTEFSSRDYEAIMYEDNDYAISITDNQEKYAAQKFVFNVSCCCCNVSLLDAINVTWKGMGVGYNNSGINTGVDLYIWNYSALAYEKLDGFDVLTGTLNGEVINPENYINNNQIIVLAEQKSNGISTLMTDYVKLVLVPKNIDC